MQDCHWQSETKFGDVLLPRPPTSSTPTCPSGARRRLRIQRLQQQPPRLHLPAQVHRAAVESKPDYDIYTLLAERWLQRRVHGSHDFEDWNRIVFEKSDLPKYVTTRSSREGYFVVRPCRTTRSPGSVPLVLRSRPATSTRKTDPPDRPRPAPTWPRLRQGGVREPDLTAFDKDDQERPPWRATSSWEATTPPI